MITTVNPYKDVVIFSSEFKVPLEEGIYDFSVRVLEDLMHGLRCEVIVKAPTQKGYKITNVDNNIITNSVITDGTYLVEYYDNLNNILYTQQAVFSGGSATLDMSNWDRWDTICSVNYGSGTQITVDDASNLVEGDKIGIGDYWICRVVTISNKDGFTITTDNQAVPFYGSGMPIKKLTASSQSLTSLDADWLRVVPLNTYGSGAAKLGIYYRESGEAEWIFWDFIDWSKAENYDGNIYLKKFVFDLEDIYFNGRTLDFGFTIMDGRLPDPNESRLMVESNVKTPTSVPKYKVEVDNSQLILRVEITDITTDGNNPNFTSLNNARYKITIKDVITEDPLGLEIVSALWARVYVNKTAGEIIYLVDRLSGNIWRCEVKDGGYVDLNEETRLTKKHTFDYLHLKLSDLKIYTEGDVVSLPAGQSNPVETTDLIKEFTLPSAGIYCVRVEAIYE